MLNGVSSLFVMVGMHFALMSAAATANAAPKEIRKPPMTTPMQQLFTRPPLQDLATIFGGKKNVNFNIWNEHRKQLGVLDRECFADELDYQLIFRDVLYPWISGWRLRRADAIYAVSDSQRLMIPDFTLDNGQRKQIGHIERTIFRELKSLKADATAKDRLDKFFKSFDSISDFELSIFQVNSNLGMRFPADLALRDAQLIGIFDLRGIDEQGLRKESRAPVEIQVHRERTGSPWKLVAWRLGKVEILKTSTPSFVETTKESGLESLPTYRRLEAIRRGGFALSLADYDNDGNPDLFIGNYGRSTLLKGDGKGHFREDIQPTISSLTRVKSALFADLENSGQEDLVVIRFAGQSVENSASPSSMTPMGQEVLLFKNDGKGRFVAVDGIKKNLKTLAAMPATIADFDNDGKLDFYVGFPGVKDFTSSLLPTLSSAKVPAEGLFWNKGNYQFVMTPLKTKDVSHAQRVFAHSALAVDFDQNGTMDILVIDDRGNLSPAYRNVGNGGFVQANKQMSVNNNAYGMGVAVADFDNDGILDLLFSNVNTLAARRIHDSCDQNWEEPYGRLDPQGIRLFKGLGDGKFNEITEQAGLDFAGEGLGGVEFIDYNRDGFMDIAVANGLWTGTDERQDLGPIFNTAYHGVVDKSNIDENAYTTVSPIMKKLATFQGDIVTGLKGSARPHLAGRQHKRLFRNLGNGQFLEVGFLEGVDSLADGYMVTKADLNSDGIQDLVFRNADPGTADVSYPPVQIFTNRNPEENHSLRIKLVGEKSNREAIGAEVKVLLDGRWRVQQVLGNNGTTQAERVLDFGLGKAEKVTEVAIRWPSGAKQKFKDMSHGHHEIRESISESQKLLTSKQ